MKGIHTLLLLSKSSTHLYYFPKVIKTEEWFGHFADQLLFTYGTVDINHDCSVIIFDRYYMLSFRTLPVAEHVITLAHRLRTIWSMLTNERIQISNAFNDSTSTAKVRKSDNILPSVMQRIVETEDRIIQKHANANRPMDKYQYQQEVESLCSKHAKSAPILWFA
jgi:ATP-dependent RNA helicase DHX34